MKAGFIGLGNMGQGMARNLLKAGHELILYNRTRSRAEALAGPGATIAATPREACAAGIVMTMLADDLAVEQTVFGAEGVFEGLGPGGLHISHSTISTALAKRLADAHRAKDQQFVSSPVFGRPDAAEAARLLLVAAGPAEAIERSAPMLEAVGRKLAVIGPDPPSANAFKLAGNFLIASVVEALAEAFTFVRKSSVDPAQFLEIVNGSLFQSPVFENYGRIMVEERYEPAGFKMQLGLKDVRLILAAADSVAAPMPLASVVHHHLLSGVARGHGDIDWSAVARVVAEDAGIRTQPRARGQDA